MRILKSIALAAILLTPAVVAGCAAPAGEVAGNVVGGTAWVVTKTGSLAWKGGKFAVQTTGRTVTGAARGVHQEFSGDKGAEANGVSTDTADLSNRVKDQPAQTLSQRQSASLAD
jgi:hypothetical protein